MKRKTTLILTVLLVGALLLTTACGLTDTIVGKIKDKIGEKVSETVSDAMADEMAGEMAKEFGEGMNFDMSGENDETVEMDQGDLDVFPSSDKIPEDYPLEFCPVYEPSKLVSAQKYGDETTSVYLLMLVTKDEAQKIKDFYGGFMEDKTLLEMGLILFQSDDGTMTANVQISPAEGDDAAKGNKSAIMISVTVTK